MMPNEENVGGVEDQVMSQIHDEIGDAVFKDGVLEEGILGKVGRVGGVEERENGEDCSWGAMEEGDEAACGFWAEFRGPVLEDQGVPSQVNCEENW